MSADLDILSRAQRDLLARLICFKDKGFYLAGGTGLALQIRHRTSADFDFYSPDSFEADEVLTKIKQNIRTVQPVQIQSDTLILKCRGIIVSLFVYPYPLLRPLIDLDLVLVASLEDIAAMKLIAIIQRGSKRDFIDCYFLIKKLGLKKILRLSQKKYEDFNSYLALQALVYFDDAEKENLSNRRIKIIEPVDWQDVKDYIITQVRQLKIK